jgi:hypothetical protein
VNLLAAFVRIALPYAALFVTAPIVAQPSPLETDDKYANPMPIARYALVVGIERYMELGTVSNATNDAQEISRTLSDPRLGFTYIKTLRNEEADTKDQIIGAINDLVAMADLRGRAATIVFYFAGHGFQLDNANFLAPRLANRTVLDRRTGIIDKSPLRDTSVPMEDILVALRSTRRPGVTILMIDACRTNNYSAPAPVETDGFHSILAAGTQRSVISFAAEAGRPAKSISNNYPENSPYAAGLRSLLIREGVELGQLLVSLKSWVAQDTGHTQIPEEVNVGAAGKHFYFHRGGAQETAETQWWTKVLGIRNKNCVEDYLFNYPDGLFAQHAMTMRTESSDDREPCVLF